ncbi:hypothetical protein ATANTOWER_014319 [Ataeniobius toweri]|uniref:Uncharacterized protein n=1 Tax=Ataeniobius toweri TaxID=208326 RepID=A0ABU7BYK3_9TELE|nr:hypothetical protein [Ataeniobius toweri]
MQVEISASFRKQIDDNLLSALITISLQCEEFLEQLTVMMKVDCIDPDLGFEMKLKLVQSRAEQLVRQEAAALSESKRQKYGLQQKVKSQKDQLERKELHIQLLKKKVSDPEEEKRS